MITKKKGVVSEQFGSRAKSARFAREDRVGHRSEHRKQEDGLRIPDNRAKRRVAAHEASALESALHGRS
ncbi:hypothetical protein LUI11_35115 [Bradyrhizobium diazoefficiens]|uniref:hypothetical protein n=1 Tax=Bradyrhizobium diazoefficiens TaxID=1355477 RepID=UPI001E4B0784|nr:hypothetical protein [Bradyrhizobium diazoefficiens]MCD9887997.1 hypothetical protein [Bradyrhizobium diazoefficiens]WRJ14680.1 hypothetical protein T8J92_40395 [Bradyrhizobium diazoefficiens]